MNYLESLTVGCLKYGPIPKHIAFIMDGNRRFAKKKDLETAEGHVLGFSQLERILQLCLDLRIQVVSVYAFSIENFKRSQEEVDRLMELAESKFHEFSTKRSLVAQLGIRIRVSGALHLLPPSVKNAAYKAMQSTKYHNKATLNICFPYTARDELSQGMSDMLHAYSLGLLKMEDMNQELLDRSLFIGDLPALEILVRTSGEIRLSDYMLWQVSENCLIHFTPVLWPEFGFLDMLKVILSYQMHQLTQAVFMTHSYQQRSPISRNVESQKRIDAYLEWLLQKRITDPANDSQDI